MRGVDGGGGVPCRMSILKYANVACLCRLFIPVSHVEFKKSLCRMTLSPMSPCRIKEIAMSPCRC